MANKLVIVESPTKTKTIGRILGKDYKIIASYGHIIDLPQKRFGVFIDDKGVHPKYIMIPTKKTVIENLRKEIEIADEIYLATDPDREGEAISYFISTLNGKKSYLRILFNEITEYGIKQGINNPTTININLVHAQQARRILDRIVGYKLSPFLWKKLAKNLSAGRVQSVALRLIVEREREIQKFVPERYWEIFANFDPPKKIVFKLNKYNGKKAEIKSKEQLDLIIKDLEAKKEFYIDKYEKKQKNINAPLPFITSSLQQEASKTYGWIPKKTMSIAQQLYEGVNINGKAIGLITYMRTDSHRVSETAISACKKYIQEKFGKNYVGFRKIKKDKNAQDAHEAIRPTYLEYEPDGIKSFLDTDQYKLYKLIFNRFIASQMKAGVNLVENIIIVSEHKKFEFKGLNESFVFDGWRRIYNIEAKNNPLDIVLTPGDITKLLKFNAEEKETKPKSRFTAGTLVKNLEDKGIGRPSTYATIVSTLFDRKYVKREAKKYIVPTDLGFMVCDLLTEGFPQILDYDFTKNVEEQLDQIEKGKLNYEKLIIDYFKLINELIKKAEKSVASKKDELIERVGRKCPKCGGDLVYKNGKFGRFIACINYPKCDYTENIEEKSNVICPKCGSPMIVRFGKWGKYLKCSNEECSYTMPYTDGLKCPKCGGYILEKHSKKGKTYWICENNNTKSEKKCDFILFSKPYKGKCNKCGCEILIKSGKKYKCSLCGNEQDELL